MLQILSWDCGRKRCKKHRVLLHINGSLRGLRLQPPLNIEPELLRKGFRILREAADDYQAGLIGDEVFRYRAGW